MSVIGHWRRSALGAGGVALLLPLGLALGVALTAALGGEDRLRALGQVVAGPDAPARAEAPGLESARDVPSVPVRRRSAGAVRRPDAAGGSAAQPGTGGAQPAAPDPSPPAPEPAAPQPAAPVEPAAPEPAAPAQPQPAPEEPGGTPLRETAEDVASTAGQVPVVGPATGDAMQTVVELIP